MRTNLKLLLLCAAVVCLVIIGVRVLIHRETEVAEESEASSTDILKSATTPTVESVHTWENRKKPTAVSTDAPTPAVTEPPDDPDDAREWTRQHPNDAATWLLSAAAGSKRDTVAEMVCVQVAQTNPAEAVALAERCAGGCSNLLENLVHQWADQNTPAARDYALSKPPGEERDHLLSRVAFVLSKESPTDAARLVAEQISPGEIQNEAAISVLHQWLLRDTNAAAMWAQLFAASPTRERALKEVENVSVSSTAVGN